MKSFVAPMVTGFCLALPAFLTACAHSEGTQTARAARSHCPTALHKARVGIEHRPDAVVVRVEATPEVRAEALSVQARDLAHALGRHQSDEEGVSGTRSVFGREVAVETLDSGMQLTFTASDPMSFAILRQRVHERVESWQRGMCPMVAPDDGSQAWWGPSGRI